MKILKYIISMAIAACVMFLVGPAIYQVYGTWSLLLNPVIGFCLGWTAMDMADKYK